MTRARAIAALDEAFVENIKRMFVVLLPAFYAGSSDDAIDKFETGLNHNIEAHAAAVEVAERLFPDAPR